MKKYLITLLAIVAVSANAALTTTIVVKAGFATNVISGSCKILSVVVANNGLIASNPIVQLYDSPNVGLVYTNAPYTNYTSYLTNWVWDANIVSNQFQFSKGYGVIGTYGGLTNLLYTNYALIDITNIVAGTTNFYPSVGLYVAPTNGSLIVSPLQQQVWMGLYATNQFNVDANLTIQYLR